MANKVDFSFGWLALKLLGKSLYSNAWSAISELVANGFDAKAKEVYIYINATNKEDANIEIFDNGSGMDDIGIETYAKIGFNKRTDSSEPMEYPLMGRKGIGKLGALYLSSNYYIITKTEAGTTKWKMEYKENTSDENEKPFLEEITVDVPIACEEEWGSCTTGTLIKMDNVDLSGLDSAAYESLHIKLANIFALDTMESRKIFLCIKRRESDEIVFNKIEKNIAFKNMAFINYSFKNNTSETAIEVFENKNNIIKFPLKKLAGDHYYIHECKVEELGSIENINISGEYEYSYVEEKEEGKELKIIKKTYRLYGWAGLHATIENKQALKNDPRFVKNKFYNPIQLRLYVRNKLAVENFLNLLGNTQAFVNYIEGELHFDILDDDDLPDIATSNRQGLNEHDPRVKILKEIAGKLVNYLINERTDLADKINKKQDELEAKQYATAKKQFSKEVQDEVLKIPTLTSSQKNNLITTVTNKIQGEVKPKNDYVIFLSHSSKDSLILDFIYHLLICKGAKQSEFFYTSKKDSIEDYKKLITLSENIKESITNKNTLILYFTSKDYKESEYCLFEAGAGWATRGIGDYLLFTTTNDEIPIFLNQTIEFSLENNKKISLGRKEYLFLIHILNEMIKHINAGREIKNEPLMQEFGIIDIPDDVTLRRNNEKIEKYMDKDILDYWNFHVHENLEEYLTRRHPPTVIAPTQ